MTHFSKLDTSLLRFLGDSSAPLIMSYSFLSAIMTLYSISRLDDNVESASHRSGGVREENVRKGNANSLAAVSDTPRESHKEENLRAGAECKDDDAEELDVDATDALRLTKNLTETVLNAEAGHEEEGSYADSYGDDEYEDYEEEDDMM